MLLIGSVIFLVAGLVFATNDLAKKKSLTFSSCRLPDHCTSLEYSVGFVVDKRNAIKHQLPEKTLTQIHEKLFFDCELLLQFSAMELSIRLNEARRKSLENLSFLFMSAMQASAIYHNVRFYLPKGGIVSHEETGLKNDLDLEQKDPDLNKVYETMVLAGMFCRSSQIAIVDSLLKYTKQAKTFKCFGVEFLDPNNSHNSTDSFDARKADFRIFVSDLALVSKVRFLVLLDKLPDILVEDPFSISVDQIQILREFSHLWVEFQEENEKICSPISSDFGFGIEYLRLISSVARSLFLLGSKSERYETEYQGGLVGAKAFGPYDRLFRKFQNILHETGFSSGKQRCCRSKSSRNEQIQVIRQNLARYKELHHLDYVMFDRGSLVTKSIPSHKKASFMGRFKFYLGSQEFYNTINDFNHNVSPILYGILFYLHVRVISLTVIFVTILRSMLIKTQSVLNDNLAKSKLIHLQTRANLQMTRSNRAKSDPVFTWKSVIEALNCNQSETIVISSDATGYCKLALTELEYGDDCTFCLIRNHVAPGVPIKRSEILWISKNLNFLIERKNTIFNSKNK